MLNIISGFSSFSVKDIDQAKEFYRKTLNLKIEDKIEMMGFHIILPKGEIVFVYSKDNHTPATFTVLNLVVDNIDEAADSLKEKGIDLERYENMHQDEKGIMRGNSENKMPTMAWFKDPAGNILSMIEKRQ